MAIPRTLLVWLSVFSLLSLTAYLWNPHPQAHVVLQPTQPSTVVQPPPPSSALHKPKRVAILGAGSSGSSSAFFLSRAAQQMAGEAEVEIVVFEREGRVGGRSTTVRPYGGEGGREIELGASIFVRLLLWPFGCIPSAPPPPPSLELYSSFAPASTS